jgi:hypothetical protein
LASRGKRKRENGKGEGGGTAVFVAVMMEVLEKGKRKMEIGRSRASCAAAPKLRRACFPFFLFPFSFFPLLASSSEVR